MVTIQAEPQWENKGDLKERRREQKSTKKMIEEAKQRHCETKQRDHERELLARKNVLWLI